jgi:hypothetical protein
MNLIPSLFAVSGCVMLHCISTLLAVPAQMLPMSLTLPRLPLA